MNFNSGKDDNLDGLDDIDDFDFDDDGFDDDFDDDFGEDDNFGLESKPLPVRAKTSYGKS